MESHRVMLLPTKEATGKRILFHGPAGYAWYLGERVTVQSLGTLTHLSPHEPPGSMMADYKYTDVERTDGIVGCSCEMFIDKELDYTTFTEEYVKYHEYPDTETDEEGNCNDDVVDVVNEISMPLGDITLPKWNTESYSMEHFSIEDNNKARWATLDENVKAVTDIVVNKLLGNINGLRLLLLSQALASRDDFKLLKRENDREVDILRREIERLKALMSKKSHVEHEEHEMHNDRCGSFNLTQSY